MKEILVNPEINKMSSLTQPINKEEDKIDSILERLNKPVLPEFIILCCKKTFKFTNNENTDLSSLRRKTQTFIKNSTINLGPSKNTNTKVCVDEFNNNTKDLTKLTGNI